MVNFDNKIVTLGNLATYHAGIYDYIASQLPVMSSSDVDSMMGRVLGVQSTDN